MKTQYYYPKQERTIRKVAPPISNSAGKPNADIYLFYTLLIFIVVIAFFDAVYPYGGFQSRIQGHGDRMVPRLLLILNLVIILYYILKAQLIRTRSPFIFKSMIISFMVYMIIYNIASPNIYWLSRVLYTMALFFPFYYNAYHRQISDRVFYIFGLSLLIVHFYGFFIGINMRGQVGGSIFQIVDNAGYSFLALFLYFSLRPNKRINIYILAFIFMAIMFSFKRGAILSAVVGYSVFLYYNLKNVKMSRKMLLPLLIGLSLITIFAYSFSDYILYRFLHDPRGGSGREEMYGLIFNKWTNADLFEFLFGHGFFSTPNILWGKYAHSDWFELLYDQGLFGILFYAILMLTAIVAKKYITREYIPAYIFILVVWSMKSLFSGVYMDRNFAIFFASIGILMGTMHRWRDMNTLVKVTHWRRK